jgi:hypothetical protein
MRRSTCSAAVTRGFGGRGAVGSLYVVEAGELLGEQRHDVRDRHVWASCQASAN